MNPKNRTQAKKTLWLWGFVLLLVFAGYPLEAQAQEAPEAGVVFQYVDPLIKVFRNTAVFPDDQARANVVRGQYATFQFVIRSNRRLDDLRVSVKPLRSGAGQIEGAEVGWVGYVHVARTARNPAHDQLRPISGFYPDPILEKLPAGLRADLTQPVWITIPISTGTAPGTYRGEVVLTARAGEEPIRIERPIAVRVYPVVVEDTRLWVTNWWYTGDVLDYMNGGEPVERYSKRYWELHRSLARTMAEYRQNVARISPLRLAEYEVEDGRYRIDFSRFDRMVELFIEEGVIGRIEGQRLATRAAGLSNRSSDFVVWVPRVRAEGTAFEKHPITSERARSFLRQFIPALVAHLKKRGWFDIYMQHVSDEPKKANADSYIAIARFIKKLAPDLRLIDASAAGPFLEGVLDIWVPVLGQFDDDYAFYKERLQAGDEVWFYTCTGPEGEYANRFIELPLIKVRLLHWINFRYGATGYLHWGYNLWRGDPFEEASAHLPSGGLVEGGDPWIVYPKEGGVLPSIRLEAMRQGIVDYELLSMLEARRPKKARKLVRQIVYDFDKYDTGVPHFRKIRQRLLALLSETLTTQAQ